MPKRQPRHKRRINRFIADRQEYWRACAAQPLQQRTAAAAQHAGTTRAHDGDGPASDARD
jgi:hypothetical protein